MLPAIGPLRELLTASNSQPFFRHPGYDTVPLTEPEITSCAKFHHMLHSEITVCYISKKFVMKARSAGSRAAGTG